VMGYMIGKSKEKLEGSKGSFDSMIKILGDDVHRDAKIDDILK
jgi:hypothetical protein